MNKYLEKISSLDLTKSAEIPARRFAQLGRAEANRFIRNPIGKPVNLKPKTQGILSKSPVDKKLEYLKGNDVVTKATFS